MSGTIHLTIEEIMEKFDLAYEKVLQICCEQHVPILHDRIDWTLFAPHVSQYAEPELASAAA